MALTETLDDSSKPLPEKKKRKWKKRSSKNPLESVDGSSSTQQVQVRKRTKSPGVRIRGGRIFDSENGKTCHQCRQKTMDVVAQCKGQRGDKPCTIMFCQKCLLNRYGEKVEETNQMDDWKCPKCRGICNCSFCMKKKGHQPTGILVHAAKATGFQSVLEMLTIAGPENLSALRKKILASKEAVSDGRDDFVPDKPSTSISDGTKIRGLKPKNGDKMIGGRKNDGTQSKKKKKKACLTIEIDLNVSLNEEETVSERMDGGEKITQNYLEKMARENNIWGSHAQSENNTEEPYISTQTPSNLFENAEDKIDEEYRSCGKNGEKCSLGDETHLIANCKHKLTRDANISCPREFNLTTESDIELPAEDVLQFLEFCNAFGEELLSKKAPDTQVHEPTLCAPLEILATFCNFVHTSS